MRDRDTSQLIYPDVDLCEAETVCVRGPGGGGCGTGTQCRKWIVNAEQKEKVTLQLVNVNAHVEVTVSTSRGTKTYQSMERNAQGHTYHISIADPGELNIMTDVKDQPLVYKYRLPMEQYWFKDFQIIVDEDRSLVMYPTTDKAQSNTSEGFLLGPDNKGGQLCWRVKGEPGMFFMITLDLRQQDRRRMVSWIAVDPVETDVETILSELK